ncbi:MAG TPA: DNA methyltransferase, partial [Paludibacter sp.]
MNLAQIERNLHLLSDNQIQKDEFVYDLLIAYDAPRSTVSRLRNGSLNKAKYSGDLVWNTKLFFRPVAVSEQLQDTFELMRLSEATNKYKPRFIVATDFETLLAHDTKTGESLDTPINELPLNTDFFLPWAGIEKYIAPEEARADVNAAGRMAKLYEQLDKDNPTGTHLEVHALNIFLTRLLFCYFAEDTGIFDDNLFTSSIASHTATDGSDTCVYIEHIFDILNVLKRNDDTPAYIEKFPYVNGGLFRDKYKIPKFTARSRRLLINSGGLNWSEINPDIFGSMIQAVITPEHRGGLGMHYTSVPNIMKVIEPLFLDDLRADFGKQKGNLKGLYKLLNRLSKIKIFDPACGSGNFLIIAYKELRKLEIEIFEEIILITKEPFLSFTNISLTQFYGIEIDDFAHEVATLSLWLAEHQMNTQFRHVFGRAAPPLPLKESGNIVCGNATRLNWQQVCPRTEEDEVYILGNPPYLGSSLQNAEKKEDMAIVFNGIDNYKNLDYIACWFYNGAKYIVGTQSLYAFVTTNSICQGEQVAMLWPLLYGKNLEVGFAHHSFKWSNNAKGNAGVTCVIIGLRVIADKPKFLFDETSKRQVDNINAYLSIGKNLIIYKRAKPISNFVEMTYGNKPTDGGFLLLTSSEKEKLVSNYPELSEIIKQFIGSDEFIKGEKRYCLWITEDNKDIALNIPEVQERISKCQLMRAASTKAATRKLVNVSYQFGEIRYNGTKSILIPRHSSENREYIP